MKSFKLSASILSADFRYLAYQVEEAEKAGIDFFHIDVMDGHFVPNITMGPFIVEALRKITLLPLEAHLMIETPEKYIGAFISAGADRVSIHVEGNSKIESTLKGISRLGALPALVLNPESPVKYIEPFLGMIDLILIMSVHPGFSGQKFIPISLEKIREARQMIDSSGKNILLEVDGGITPGNVRLVLDAGVDVIVAATSIFHSPNGIAEGIRDLRTAS